MNYYKYIGLAACITLAIACFIPWAYYPDLHKSFTGMYSENNNYGKPGRFLCFFAIVSAGLILLPKVWAKRLHLFLSALFMGYAIKSYILFTSCYGTFCPEKQTGIYLLMFSCFVILILSIFPKVMVPSEAAVS